MRRREFVGSAAILTAATACTSRAMPRAAVPSEPDRGLDATVVRAMGLAGVPGVAAGRLRSGAVEHHVWGVSDVRTNAPILSESVFEAASLTKPVTAYIAITLATRGVLDIDAPLVSYGVPAPNPADDRGARVTTRHVLSHSSGWRNWRRASDPPLTADFEPGSRYQYSGEGFVQLQRVMEHVAGRGFAELGIDIVFEPLGMTSSAFLTDPATVGKTLVTGHDARQRPRESHGVRVARYLERSAANGRPAVSLRVAEVEALIASMEPPSPAIPAMVMPNAAGSLVTTVGDYLRFWSHLLVTGTPAAGILGRMATLVTPINNELSWGLGLGRETANGELRLWHQGDNPGFKNFLSVHPERREAVVVFTNGDTGMRVAERVMRAMTGHDHGGFVWA